MEFPPTPWQDIVDVELCDNEYELEFGELCDELGERVKPDLR